MTATIHPFTHSYLDQVGDTRFELIYVAGDSFQMGSEDQDAYEWVGPVHSRQVSSFYIGRYLVSQGLWAAVMGENPSFWEASSHPVEQVSWEDCQRFLTVLQERTGTAYRLPSEAEWEYAARGGRYSQQTQYAGSSRLPEVGWYDMNSHEQTQALGHRRPNELGIYDMSGQLYEWCQDEWHSNYEGAPIDSSPWQQADGTGDSAASRVLRGGAWFGGPLPCRVSYRNRGAPQLRDQYRGLRLALSPQSAG